MIYLETHHCFSAIMFRFVNSFVYYGLSFGVSVLEGSPHVNLVLSGAMEFPGFIIAGFTLNRFGRRWPLVLFMVFGGVACCTVPAIPESKHLVYHIMSSLLYLVDDAHFRGRIYRGVETLSSHLKHFYFHLIEFQMRSRWDYICV